MLRKSDKDSLQIEEFIFHPILKTEEEISFFDEVELSTEQKQFFKGWMANSITEGVEYEFIDKTDENGLFKKAQEIKNDRKLFVEYSKSISSAFKSCHKGSSSEGILVVSFVKVESGNLLFLVKLDFSRVFSFDINYENGKRKVTLREVKNPISENKEAIQKVAIINIDTNYFWDVLAQDKQNRVSYKIADYFKTFLRAEEREVSALLTTKSFDIVKNWLNENKLLLDPEQNITDYKGRAYDFLKDSNEFDSSAFINAIVYDPNETRRVDLRTSLQNKLVKEELAERAFRVNSSAIPPGKSKNTWITSQGIKITFWGSAESNSISITEENNQKIITIKTASIDFK